MPVFSMNGPRVRPTKVKFLLRLALLLARPWWVMSQPRVNEILPLFRLPPLDLQFVSPLMGGESTSGQRDAATITVTAPASSVQRPLI